MAKKPIIYEYYDNIYKFINTVENRKNNNFFGTSSETGNFDFTGTNSYAEAKEQFENGLSERAQELKRAITQFKTQAAKTVSKSRPINYYSGYAPDISAAIIGLPKSMKYIQKTPQKIKAISLYYYSGANCNIEADTLLNSGKTVLQLIYYLETKNIRTSLYLIPMCADSDERDFSCMIKLKDFRQNMDILKLTFPITSPSMFRRFAFKWSEGLEGFTSHVHGYGHSMDIEKAREALVPHMEKDSYLINYQLCQKSGFDAVQLAKDLNIIK